jgi:hypothetical protein
MTPASSFEYIETTVPAGMTISQYRAARPPRLSRRQRVATRLRRTSPRCA